MIGFIKIGHVLIIKSMKGNSDSNSQKSNSFTLICLTYLIIPEQILLNHKLEKDINICFHLKAVLLKSYHQMATIYVMLVISFFFFSRSPYDQPGIASQKALEGLQRDSSTASDYDADRYITTEDNMPSFMYDTKPKEYLLDQWLGPQANVNDPKRDLKYMRKFTKAADESELPDIKGIDFSHILPNSAPLVVFLLNEIERTTKNNMSYNTPQYAALHKLRMKAGINEFTNSNIDTREVTIGSSDTEDFFQWIMSNFEQNQLQFPSGLLSLDVEEIKIPKVTEELIMKRHKALRETGQPQDPVTCPVPTYKQGDCSNIIAKIILGDGVSWFASIRFPWKYKTTSDGKRSYVFPIVDIKASSQTCVFLSQPTAWTGHGVMNDRNMIQDAFLDIYDIKLKLPLVLEIDALTAAAGYKFRKSDMFVTNLLVNGSLLNKNVSCADGRWAQALADLPDAFQIYLIGDVRYGYITSMVLLSILIRDLFPDPEVVCFTLEISQIEWVTYFCALVTDCLGDLAYNPRMKACAFSRKELLCSLRAYDNSTKPRKMKRGAEINQTWFSNLLPPWPSIIHGGVKYIHLARDHFSSQYEYLQVISYVSRVIHPNLSREMNPELKRALNFNRDFPTGTVCIPGKEDFDASHAWPEFQSSVYRLNLNDLTCDSLFTEAARVGRNLQISILEAVRLDPQLLRYLFNKLRKIPLEGKTEYRFWREKVTLYDRLRLLFTRSSGRMASRVPELEGIIQKKQTFVIQEQITAQSGETRSERGELISVLGSKANQEARPRSNVQQQMLAQMPGENYSRNKTSKDARKFQKKQSLGRAKSARAKGAKGQPTKVKADLREHLQQKRSVGQKRPFPVDLYDDQPYDADTNRIVISSTVTSGEYERQVKEYSPPRFESDPDQLPSRRYTSRSEDQYEQDGWVYRGIDHSFDYDSQPRRVHWDDPDVHQRVDPKSCLIPTKPPSWRPVSQHRDQPPQQFRRTVEMYDNSQLCDDHQRDYQELTPEFNAQSHGSWSQMLEYTGSRYCNRDPVPQSLRRAGRRNRNSDFQVVIGSPRPDGYYSEDIIRDDYPFHEDFPSDERAMQFVDAQMRSYGYNPEKRRKK
jgi:hypothetical protein